MKFNIILYRQHLARMFKKHWVVQGSRVPIETGAEDELKSRNIPVFNPKDVLKKPTQRFDFSEVIGFKPKVEEAVPKDRRCFVYKDNNVLVGGVQQVQVLLKTIKIDNLPEYNFQTLKLDSQTKRLIEQAVISSHLYDAEQQTLPKIKDPERPAWNFPRVYGITYNRRMRLLTTKLLKICDSVSKKQLKNKFFINDIKFAITFEREQDLVQLNLTADRLLLTNQQLLPIYKEDTIDQQLPSIFPLSQFISIPDTSIYDTVNQYPFEKPLLVPHTLFVYFDKTKVANLYETEVTQDQITSRALLKTFAVAASYAKNVVCSGKEIELPKPVTVQYISTDGKFFQFGVLQLNTLNLKHDHGKKNIWYCTEPVELFRSCEYINGQPILNGLDYTVFDKIKHIYDKQ